VTLETRVKRSLVLSVYWKEKEFENVLQLSIQMWKK
jgi:hypothetical protein